MAPLPIGEKLACFLRLIAFTVKILPKLTRDLIIAAEELFWRFTDRFRSNPPGLSPADKLHRTTAL
jgi:hypothetical protein